VNQALSYEQARDELAEVVKRLEAGGLSLEESLSLWERGERLAAICAEWLEGARARIATAMAQRSAEPGTAGATGPAGAPGAAGSAGAAAAKRGTGDNAAPF
jgi:exodeoxyribonuclease VII small subunit